MAIANVGVTAEIKDVLTGNVPTASTATAPQPLPFGALIVGGVLALMLAPTKLGKPIAGFLVVAVVYNGGKILTGAKTGAYSGTTGEPGAGATGTTAGSTNSDGLTPAQQQAYDNAIATHPMANPNNPNISNLWGLL